MAAPEETATVSELFEDTDVHNDDDDEEEEEEEEAFP